MGGIIRLFIVCLLAMTANTVGADEHSFIPADGFVPNNVTAIAIAEAILVPIYGQAQVIAERPFTATLDIGQWSVVGHLELGQAGGVASVVIDKATGKILRVTHGR